MGIALARLAAEDPSFRVETDIESGQTIMKGMGELHLDILVDRMRREFKVEANIGAPQVAYRETISNAHEIDYTHKKQTVARASSPASNWSSTRPNPARAIRSNRRLWVVPCRRNTSPALKKASSR